MGFLKKDLQNKNLIVLDVGDQFIKALLLDVDDQGRGIIHSWTKESISDKEKGFIKAVRKINKNSKTKNKEIFLGIGGETIKGISTALYQKRDNPDQRGSQT